MANDVTLKVAEGKRPAVSVLMPALNAASTIDASIASVIRQSHRDLELLVIDDGSNDGTREIVQEWGRRDVRVHLMSTNGHEGSAKARNVGTDAARGRFVAFCDSDDVWHPEKLRKQLAFMGLSGAVLCGTAFQRMSEDGQPLPGILAAPREISLGTMLRTNYLCCSSVMYDTVSAGKLYMPDHRDGALPFYLRYFKSVPTHDDFLTWITFLQAHPSRRAHVVSDVLTFYRVRFTSQSGNKVKAALVRWHIYRNVLRLPFIQACKLFAGYAIDAIWRRRPN